MATPNEHYTTLLEGFAIKSKLNASLHWMTAILVSKGLATNLHILEDDHTILWLGKDMFVELSIHGTSGWQIGVSSLVFLHVSSFVLSLHVVSRFIFSLVLNTILITFKG